MTSLTTPTIDLITEATPIVLPIQSADCYNDVRTELTAIFDDFWLMSAKCIFIPEALRATFILWSFLAHMKDFVHFAPLLIIDAPTRGCGKSTLQQFLAVMNEQMPEDRYTDFTKAGLKKISGEKAVFLDEIDSITRTDLRNVTNYLNTSFEENGAQSINALTSGSSFGFRCIAGINALNKLMPATQSRCIHLSLIKTPSDKKLEKKFHELPLDHFYGAAEELQTTIEKYSTKLQYYFTYVDYPQKAVLTNRFGDVWRNMFDLASLLGEKYVNYLMTCVKKQYHLDEAVEFPNMQYYVNARQYKEPEEPEFYDGTDDDSTDYSTKDFLAGVKAVLNIYSEKSKTGVQTKELFRLISILNIKNAPITQRTLGRYMTDLGFQFNKNVDKNSGYRFDETFATISTKYPKAIDEELCTAYMEQLQPHI